MIKEDNNKERQWVISAIRNAYELVIFQHEKDKLDDMMAKYSGQFEVSDRDLKEDIQYLDRLYDN